MSLSGHRSLELSLEILENATGEPRPSRTMFPVYAHLALDLLDEQEGEAILVYCEEHLV